MKKNFTTGLVGIKKCSTFAPALRQQRQSKTETSSFSYLVEERNLRYYKGVERMRSER